MQVNWSFNANQYQPSQSGMGAHPPAFKIPFTITNTEIKPTKDSTDQNPKGYLSVEFTSPIGVIRNIYNIKNDNPKTVEIAYGQLSALCHAIGIYQIDGSNECAALRGGKGLMDVGYQKDEEPNPQFPDRKGFTELKKVYDAAGNEPGKVAQQPQAQQAQPQGGSAPLQQQPGGSWGNAQPQQQQPAQQAPNPAPQQGGQAWQPGGAAPAANPPWGNR